ncbi:TPA: hypothetical protein PTV68_002040 [Clostridium botulinum]|uniref:hypothetical protein n=1 Tax=Clostridium botulinum TaxID=1491 RepID=UPI0029A593FF|nr:hypothetical protein [Clostridium botulinum]HDK7188704.1 hypothetical protein [Clostridium botulinum]HDK7215623.1 hypothetical protein [Clostridium botulinum]HDK7231377.1 hypothetical protein [Clostridium botulinum]HDK7260735.1 hypothetical protein [Clostridium botulinum]
MGLFGNKNKSKSINVLLVDGISNYTKDIILQLTLNDESECLTINSKVCKNNPDINLKYEQIIDANIITEEEIIQQSKSVIGRAAVGGLLLGPLGAIVGGMSGTGTKTNNQIEYYAVVNYKSRDHELKVLSFKIVGFSNWKSFIKELKSKINNQNTKEEIYL